jgi:hypothetical protein
MQDYYQLDMLSNSRLGVVKCLRDGLPIFKAKKETLEFGKQFHESVLEPHKYNDFLSLALENQHNGAGTWVEWYIKNRHKVAAMSKSALNNALLKFLIDSPLAKFEQDHFFNESKYDLECKAKIDLWVGKTIADLKTTAAKTREEFEASILQYGYNRQGAFYLDGTGAEKFIIIGVCKTYPHPTFTCTMAIDDPRIVSGRKEYEDLIDVYLEMKQEGKIDFQELMQAA